MSKPRQSLQQVRSRYEQLRFIARDEAHNALPHHMSNKRKEVISKEHIKFASFDTKTGVELRKYQNSPRRRVQWDWAAVSEKYLHEPKRFELAIWHKDLTLCGASMGKPSGKGGKMRLDFIEAHPEGSPLMAWLLSSR